MARGDEGALRGLVGAGPSQLGVSGALRVRDALRLSAEDLEAAEARVVLRYAAPRTEEPLPNDRQGRPLS